MSLNHTLLRVNYDLMFNSLHPLELKEQDGIIRCKLTWLAAKARPGMLDRLTDYARTSDKIVWFQASDPYGGSKPFDITWIGLENLLVGEKIGSTIVLVVTGQKSERIKKKWTGKLSPFFGYPVSIIWEEDAQ